MTEPTQTTLDAQQTTNFDFNTWINAAPISIQTLFITGILSLVGLSGVLSAALLVEILK